MNRKLLVTGGAGFTTKLQTWKGIFKYKMYE